MPINFLPNYQRNYEMKVTYNTCTHCAWIERGLLNRCIYNNRLLIDLYWRRRERECQVFTGILYPTIPE